MQIYNAYIYAPHSSLLASELKYARAVFHLQMQRRIEDLELQDIKPPPFELTEKFEMQHFSPDITS